jgi:type III secretion protein C
MGRLRRTLGRVAPSALVAALTFSCAPELAVAGTPPSWKEATAYSFRASGMPLQRVLAEFARSQGVVLVGAVPGAATTVVRLSGQAPSAEQFLERLALEYQFQWFVYAGRLHVSALTDRVTEHIGVGDGSAADAKQALIGLGLFEQRFGWGEFQEQGQVVISGPREYVRLVRAALKVPEDSDPSTMVYKVRHGFVEDREISFRSQTVTVPGLVTILRNLARDSRLDGRLRDGGGSGASPTALVSEGVSATANPAPRVTSTDTSGSRRRDVSAVIEGDVRTNMLIIRDTPDRRSYYLTVLRALDVPLRQIEIEAMIIDVERSRLHELGINWQAFAGGGSGRTEFVVGNPASADQSRSPGSLTVLNPARLLAAVRALENDGDARLVARPAVTTMDNLAAVIDLSQTAVVRVVGERTAGTRDVTAGTMLKVTPKIILEGDVAQVRLLIDIEDGKLIPGAPGDPPSVAKTIVATQAQVDDRQSLVIGGLRVRDESQGEGGVPGLRSIPGLGWMFRWEKKESTTRERLFLITPRVVEQQRAQETAETLRSREDAVMTP